NVQTRPTYLSPGSNRSDRNGTHQPVQTLVDLKLDPKPRCGTVGHAHFDNLARIHAGNFHFGAFGQPAQICEFRIEVDMACEYSLPVPDEEYSDREEGQSCPHEKSDKETMTPHPVILPSDSEHLHCSRGTTQHASDISSRAILFSLCSTSVTVP